jgi:pantoate--beta-alanine ligase
MLIFKEIAQLKAFLSDKKSEGKTIGFVPTMGALHPGHVSLIALSKKQCDITVCSIFVNPTQFNDKKDLDRYPRTPENDVKLLEKANCDMIFIPSVEEIYPDPVKETFDFGYLNTTLEGKFRPGHFNGVAQVVKRFFTIVEPDKAFFGSKDYQQVMIIKALVKLMHLPIEIVPCPILREPDGLAMSSRNALLNAEERITASLIPKIMLEARGLVKTSGIEAAKCFVQEQTATNPLMRLDYYEICEADNLRIIQVLEKNKSYISVIAVFVGRIRLIDNLPVDAGL